MKYPPTRNDGQHGSSPISHVIDRERANRLYRRALEVIDQTGALPVPKYFQLFFEYAEGSNQALVDTVDDLLQRDGQPSSSELDLLCDVHLPDTVERDQFDEMGDRLGKEVVEAMDVVREAVSSTGSYGDSVSDAELALGESSDPEQIRVAVASLVQVTREMSQHCIDLNSKLLLSVEQIEELKGTLERVKRESRKDALTGVSNRKCFDLTLMKEIEEARSRNTPLCLCMIDLDHFKKFNDNFGHRMGDSALRIVASIFDHNVRDNDLVARYGGEEFAVVMPNAELKTAVAVSNRIRETLTSKHVVRRSTGEHLGNISVSVGVAQFRDDDTPCSLIERADGALYEAKRAGRNRVQPALEQRDEQAEADTCVA